MFLPSNHRIPLFLLINLFFLRGTTSIPNIGVTYSHRTTTHGSAIAIHPPPLDRLVEIATKMGFPAVRLPDSDLSVVRAFSYSNFSLLLSIPNLYIPALAANRTLAQSWIYTLVFPFHRRSKISLISVGNDVFSSDTDISSLLLPAIRNIYLALRDLGIRKISVSTTFSFFNIITTAFPPSMAQLQQPVGELIVRPLLQFLEDTNSSFLVNIFPYNLYCLNNDIPIGFALFQDHPFNFRDDPTTGVRYRNLFDVMIDSVISAFALAGYENMPLIVAETGWPSSSTDPVEVDASPFYAEMYLKGLVRHLRSGLGTPLSKESVKEVYIYELIDKETNLDTKSWGIFYQNMTNKYHIDYSGVCMIGEVKNSMVAFLVVVEVFVLHVLKLRS